MALDSSLVIYTGPTLPYIPVAPNTDLETILGAINTAINASSAAPDYSGYGLACVTQTDGVSHPTNTQNFAEGISKILCDLITAYTTFTVTTYPTAIGTLTTAVTNLQTPGIAYAPFSILTTDTVTVVWNKVYTGLSAIIASILPTGANWSSLSLSNQTTIVNAFNAIIAYELGQDTAIGTKQASLGTFDATPIGGGATDSPATAIGEMITAIAANKAAVGSASLTSTCVTIGSSYSATMQNMLNKIDSVASLSVAAAGTAMVLSGSGCSGKTLGLDLSYQGLYKSAVSSTDPTPDYLAAKFTSLDNSVTIVVNGDTTIDLSAPGSDTYKVKVNSADTSPNFLSTKIVGGSDDNDWGLGVITVVAGNSDTLQVKPIISPGKFVEQLLNYISTEPEALAQLCAVIAQCTGCSCGAPTDLLVTVTTT